MGPVALPPGFRFHPTDEELVAYYLRRKINGHKIDLEIIPDIDLYQFEPWELPSKSLLPSNDMEWYYFSSRDRKYPNGSRTNRATKAGYWKSTGKDRQVNSESRLVGMKKTLVYYQGRAPNGHRTDWVMHEYRLDERECENNSGLQDAYALCRVFKKNPIAVQNVASTSTDEVATDINITQLSSELDQSSTVEILSEGKWDDFIDSSEFSAPIEKCSSNLPCDVEKCSSNLPYDVEKCSSNLPYDEKCSSNLPYEKCSSNLDLPYEKCLSNLLYGPSSSACEAGDNGQWMQYLNEEEFG